MNKYCRYINPTPVLTIHAGPSKKLGHCYSGGEFKIVSSNKLKKSDIVKLWEMGLLGYGQEFNIQSACDGTEQPAGFIEVAGVMKDDDGKIYDEPAVYWDGRPAAPARFYYYEYVTSWRCDSGD